MNMNLKEIQELIKLVNKFNLTEVNIENKDFKISIKADSDSNSSGGNTRLHANSAESVTQLEAQLNQETSKPDSTDTSSASTDGKTDAETPENLDTIKSPMIGTFYRRSAPEKEPFVKVGDTIQAGDVICIIEAMKLFNEIEAEVSGKIVKILSEDSSPVEYDQPLFLIEPNG